MDELDLYACLTNIALLKKQIVVAQLHYITSAIRSRIPLYSCIHAVVFTMQAFMDLLRGMSVEKRKKLVKVP